MFVIAKRDATDYPVENQSTCSVSQLEIPEQHVPIFFEGLAAPGGTGNTGIKINQVFFTGWVMTYFAVHMRGKASGKIHMETLLLT